MPENVGVAQANRIPGEGIAEGPLVGVARAVETTARQVKEKVVRTKDELAQKSIGELVDDGRNFVRENPGKTILISVGVGALVGYLIGRRRS